MDLSYKAMSGEVRNVPKGVKISFPSDSRGKVCSEPSETESVQGASRKVKCFG